MALYYIDIKIMATPIILPLSSHACGFLTLPNTPRDIEGRAAVVFNCVAKSLVKFYTL